MRWTYREFGDRVARIVAVLKGLGLRSGSSLALLSPNRADVWAIMSATLVMGMRYTPLHPLSAEEDQAFIVDDAEADILIGRQDLCAAVSPSRARADTETSDGDRRGPMAFRISSRPMKARFAPLVDEWRREAISAGLAYTGGTTGRSGGAKMTHRSMVTAVLSVYSDGSGRPTSAIWRRRRSATPRPSSLAYNDGGALLLPDAGLPAGAIVPSSRRSASTSSCWSRPRSMC